MRPVLVEWIDAQADADRWTSRAELNREPRRIRTVGYIVADVIDGHTTVAASWDEDTDHYGAVMHIPDAMIVRVVKLRGRRAG